ncbi:MAG: tRNA (adenine-N1)-methyltransferase [Desulfurococcaceae archaeon]
MEITREGETVLVLIDSKRKFLTKLARGKILGTDKGYIHHDSMIGIPYGSTVKTSQGVTAYVLKPLRLDYYSAGVTRVTQVIHPKDVALMIYLSGISPGSRVGEAGVGSGVLTLAIASVIGDKGKLYGFDISDKALECARLNLEKTGLADRVDLRKHDVRTDLAIEEALDAFFVDIPDPWNALRSISRVLKPSAPVLIYVPTVNQVEKTVLALRETGVFIDIHTYETLLREYRVEKDAVRPRSRMIGHTGYIVFARKSLEMSSLNV